MRPSRRPRVEQLEDRTTPAVFGHPWPDAQRLTVSFVPDGTAIGPAWTDAAGVVHDAPSSQLFAAMSARPTAVWQGEILRALQSWAAQTNIGLILVADSGDPLGTPGASQGDARFGDIRVAAGSLSAASVSASVPYSPLAGTWSGDLMFNTSYDFDAGDGVGFDLYSVALHEAGHIFGVGGTLNAESVMFEYYNGVHHDLGDAEAAAIQTLYGVREPDRFEGMSGNDTPALATPLSQAAARTFRSTLRQAGEDAEYDEPLVLTADLTTISDVDVYRYRTTRQAPGFTVRLQTADLSLLNVRLTVLDAAGQVVAQAESAGELVLRIEGQARATYYIRVEGAAEDVFAVGRYRLAVEPDADRPTERFVAIWQRFLTRMHDDDSLRTAKRIAELPATREGRINDESDVDYYRVRLPQGTTSLSLLVVGGGPVGVALLDARGRVVASRDSSGHLMLRQDGLDAGKVYYLAVTGATGTEYRLSVHGTVPTVTLPVVADGVLTADVPQAFRGLLLPRGGLMHLELDLGLAASAEVVLFDLHGNVVHRGFVIGGQLLRWDLLLPAGAYTFRFVGGSTDGGPLADAAFTIRGTLLSDPIGPPLIDPTVVPTREIDPSWFGGGFYVELALVDPFGRPLTLITVPVVVDLPVGSISFE